VRIGEGAMIGGLSGARADVIPFGYAVGQLADLVGLNIVGLKRRGVARADMHRLRRAYRALLFGAGAFRARLENVAGEFAADVLVSRVIAFIRAGGTQPLTMAVHRGEASEPASGAPA